MMTLETTMALTIAATETRKSPITVSTHKKEERKKQSHNVWCVCSLKGNRPWCHNDRCLQSKEKRREEKASFGKTSDYEKMSRWLLIMMAVSRMRSFISVRDATSMRVLSSTTLNGLVGT